MRIHEQRDLQAANIANALLEIQWMREHLASSKFQGELEDNINVRDVDDCMLRIREALEAQS